MLNLVGLTHAEIRFLQAIIWFPLTNDNRLLTVITSSISS